MLNRLQRNPISLKLFSSKEIAILAIEAATSVNSKAFNEGGKYTLAKIQNQVKLKIFSIF